MKRTLLLSALFAVGTATPSMAQLLKKPTHVTRESITSHKEQKARVHDAILRQLTGYGVGPVANKTTSTTTDERLLAQSTYAYSDTTSTGTGTPVWVLSDSSDYAYTGERGSRFNFNNMGFIDYYSLNTTMPMGLGKVFGGSDKYYKPEVLFDSSHIYVPFTSATPELLLTLNMNYDASGNINDYMESYIPFAVYFRFLNTFGADGPTSITYLQNFGSSWDTSDYRQMGYTSGQLTFDSSASNAGASTWSPEYKYQYTYDASGNPTRVSMMVYDATVPGMWYEGTRYDMEYNTAGKVSKITTRGTSDPTVPLAPQEVDTIGWTSGINYMTYLETRYCNSDSVVNDQFVRTLHINSANLPDSVYTVESDPSSSTVVNAGVNVYTYDTYNNPVTNTAYGRSVPTTPTYDTMTSLTHYYYQLYTRDNTGVNDVAKNSTFRLYPNPANNDLFIAQDKLTANASDIATVKMYDLTGRLVASVKGNNGITKVSMTILPQGTYMVILQDAQGNMLHQTKVVKL